MHIYMYVYMHTFSVPPHTRTVPLSFMAIEYTESFCPLRVDAEGGTYMYSVYNVQYMYMC